MCLLFLLWSSILLCEFIVCFTKKNTFMAAIKFSIELKQGPKNQQCEGVYGVKGMIHLNLKCPGPAG